MSPMSWTGGGGGGGGGGTGFARFFAAAVAGLGFAFELLVTGFFVVVAGFAGDVACAFAIDTSMHAATRAAASFKARESDASMGADSTHARAGTHILERGFALSGALFAVLPG